ncbi:signal peptidase I [Patescibacteria group bacterium]|nr:signal peptidase I [Patescibacteria group bacterium]
MKKKTKKEKIKKVLSIIINVILGFFIVLGLVIAFSMIPFKNNFKILAVMSGSMKPTIKTGSLVFIKPSPVYNQGEIISFHPSDAKTEKGTVTHRIYYIESSLNHKFYITKGDANNAPDPQRISEDRIVGKYIFAVPVLGYLIGFIKTIPGLVLIIIIPATIIIYEESKKIKLEIKNIIKKRKQEMRKAEG